MTEKQKHLIVSLGICGQMSAAELSDSYRDAFYHAGHGYNWVGWDAGGLAMTLKRLEKKGVVERVPTGATHPFDPKHFWRLSQEGLTFFRELCPDEEGTRKRSWSGTGRREKLTTPEAPSAEIQEVINATRR